MKIDNTSAPITHPAGIHRRSNPVGPLLNVMLRRRQAPCLAGPLAILAVALGMACANSEPIDVDQLARARATGAAGSDAAGTIGTGAVGGPGSAGSSGGMAPTG